MHTLYLTADEQKVFAKIPEDLTKDLTVETETLSYEDTPLRRGIRLKQMQVADPLLKKFFGDAASTHSEDAFAALLKDLNLSSITDGDIAELIFAIGPDGAGFMIEEALLKADKRDTVELAVALSLLRHEMLESLIAPTV